MGGGKMSALRSAEKCGCYVTQWMGRQVFSVTCIRDTAGQDALARQRVWISACFSADLGDVACLAHCTMFLVSLMSKVVWCAGCVARWMYVASCCETNHKMHWRFRSLVKRWIPAYMELSCFRNYREMCQFFLHLSGKRNYRESGFWKETFFLSTDVKRLGTFLLTVGSDLLKATTEIGEICYQRFACEEFIFARI